MPFEGRTLKYFITPKYMTTSIRRKGSCQAVSPLTGAELQNDYRQTYVVFTQKYQCDYVDTERTVN